MDLNNTAVHLAIVLMPLKKKKKKSTLVVIQITESPSCTFKEYSRKDLSFEPTGTLSFNLGK